MFVCTVAQVGQVMVECRGISEKDRQLHPSLPPDIHYRATLIWVGPARPRNDKEDPNRNDTGIFQGMLTNIAFLTDSFCRHLLLKNAFDY